MISYFDEKRGMSAHNVVLNFRGIEMFFVAASIACDPSDVMRHLDITG